MLFDFSLHTVCFGLYKQTCIYTPMLECIPSQCSVYNCTHFKSDSFPCADSMCSGTVHANVIHGGLQYLDDPNEQSVVKGVSIDPSVYRRRPDLQSPREKHEYYCADCTRNLYRDKPLECRDVIKDETKKRTKARFEKFEHEKQLSVFIPESMSVLDIGKKGEKLRIRALGAGYDPAKISAIASEAIYDIYGKKRDRLRSTVFDVSNSMLTISTSSSTREQTIFGIFVEDQLFGIFNTTLTDSDTESDKYQLQTTLYLGHVYLHGCIRGLRVGSFILEFCKNYAYLLNDAFSIKLDTVLLVTSASNNAMNSTAQNCGFELSWNDGSLKWANVWKFHLARSSAEAQSTYEIQHFGTLHRMPQVLPGSCFVEFAYWYKYKDIFYSARTSVPMPICQTWHESQGGSAEMYAFFERANQNSVSQDWLQEQAAFMESLCDNERMTLYTNQMGGHTIIREFLKHHIIETGVDTYMYERRNNLVFFLFEPQICRIYGTRFDTSDPQKCAKFLDCLTATQWTKVFWEFIVDLQAIFAKAPVLKRALATYCVSKVDNMSIDNYKYCVESFSIDASVAPRLCMMFTQKNPRIIPRIFQITWQPGSRLIFSAGIEGENFLSLQVLAFSPVFSETASAIHIMNVNRRLESHSKRSIDNRSKKNVCPVTDSYLYILQEART